MSFDCDEKIKYRIRVNKYSQIDAKLNRMENKKTQRVSVLKNMCGFVQNHEGSFNENITFSNDHHGLRNLNASIVETVVEDLLDKASDTDNSDNEEQEDVGSWIMRQTLDTEIFSERTRNNFYFDNECANIHNYDNNWEENILTERAIRNSSRQICRIRYPCNLRVTFSRYIAIKLPISLIKHQESDLVCPFKIYDLDSNHYYIWPMVKSCFVQKAEIAESHLIFRVAPFESVREVQILIHVIRKKTATIMEKPQKNAVAGVSGDEQKIPLDVLVSCTRDNEEVYVQATDKHGHLSLVTVKEVDVEKRGEFRCHIQVPPGHVLVITCNDNMALPAKDFAYSPCHSGQIRHLPYDYNGGSKTIAADTVIGDCVLLSTVATVSVINTADVNKKRKRPLPSTSATLKEKPLVSALKKVAKTTAITKKTPPPIAAKKSLQTVTKRVVPQKTVKTVAKNVKIKGNVQRRTPQEVLSQYEIELEDEEDDEEGDEEDDGEEEYEDGEEDDGEEDEEEGEEYEEYVEPVNVPRKLVKKN